MNYQKAKIIADRLVTILGPHCELINIAGSVRRNKPDVKDIELVLIPKRTFKPNDLFGDGTYVVSAAFVSALEQVIKRVIKGNPEGRYMQIDLKTNEQINLDLFMPDPVDYYRIYAIRTGSREYAQKVIAGGWLRKGWCGSDKHGLRRTVDCMSYQDKQGKLKWKCIRETGDKPPVWKSEEEFFQWLGVPFLKPSLRN